MLKLSRSVVALLIVASSVSAFADTKSLGARIQRWRQGRHGLAVHYRIVTSKGTSKKVFFASKEECNYARKLFSAFDVKDNVWAQLVGNDGPVGFVSPSVCLPILNWLKNG